MKLSKATIKALKILDEHGRAIHPELFAMRMWPTDEEGYVSRARRRNWARMGGAYLSKLSQRGLVEKDTLMGYTFTWRMTQQGRAVLENL